MTIKEANEKVFRCMRMADFVRQSAKAMAKSSSGNVDNVGSVSWGLASIAEKISDELSDVTGYLREEVEAESESGSGKEATHD